MQGMDAVTLARIQFAVTAGFHFLFPPISIGLGVFLVAVRAIAYKTDTREWNALADFWTKIFALVFAFGVATGVVLEFEFGTNWARYSRYVGDIFGSPLAAEAIFAFFMESCFLGIVLFGKRVVSRGFYLFSTFMVCLGAHLSALWILVANSWMQTPAGYHLVETENGVRAEITDFWAMVFNPSTLDRVWHVLVAAWLTGAFMVLAVSAWHLLKGRFVPVAERGLKVGIAAGCAAVVLQFASGHASSMLIEQVQPVKFAAMEGHYDSSEPAGFHVIGWADDEAKTVRGITVPAVISVMLGKGVEVTDETRVLGLNDVPDDLRPPTQLTFQGYHWMVYSAIVMCAVLGLGIWFWYHGKLRTARWWLAICVPAALLPHFAIQMGWIATEVGRQPWIVQGLLRTKDAFSENVAASQLWFSLIFFSLIYVGLLVLFLFLLFRKIGHGPEYPEFEPVPAPAPDGNAAAQPQA